MARGRSVRAGVVCLLVSALAAAAFGAVPAYLPPRPATAGKGRLELVGGIPVLHLRGTPEQMGEQHGRLLGAQLAVLRRVYLDTFFGNAVSRAGALAFGMGLVPHMPPACVTEMKAMAAASGVDYPGVVFANTFTDTSRAIFCSVVVACGKASRGGRLVIGRNLDFPSLGVLHKATVLVVYHHTAAGRRPFVAVGWPGVVGVVTGMNDAGLCVATLVSATQKGVSPGMPYTMMHRLVLEQCATPQEALALVKRTARTSANNLVVASPEAEPLVIEYSAEKVAARTSVGGLLLATNHFRCTDFTANPRPLDNRFATLAERTARQRGRIDVPALKTMLHAVNQGRMTLQSMVFEPSTRRLHLATGSAPASAAAYVAIDCGKLLAAK